MRAHLKPLAIGFLGALLALALYDLGRTAYADHARVNALWAWAAAQQAQQAPK